MKLSFSTLACPDWTMPQMIAIASTAGYDGIELRFVEGEDSLWKLSALQAAGLVSTKRALADHGLTISCLDTSCRFDSPDPADRQHWLSEGEKMSDLATELGAPGLRVFGDTIRPGADRASTRGWIADSISQLAEIAAPKGVEVWLETHGDFASARDTSEILARVTPPNTGVVWDPVNSFVATRERPAEASATLGPAIRHVHVKDVRRNAAKGDPESWPYVLTGEGDFPLQELLAALKKREYSCFLSFEWEKKWHPELADAEIALPHFVEWFRKNSANMARNSA
jgi:sugar phosphate isomerase/epimerase